MWHALAGLILVCGLLEGASRTPAAALVFPIESFGSSHPHFNTQVSRILTRAASGPIDCIFLGDSQVLHDLEPSVVEPIASASMGSPVRCQNFGLGGMTTPAAAYVGRMLIDRFHPRVLLFGTSVLNYIPSALDSSYESIVSSPWLQYQLGEPSLDGWLLDKSKAYRLYLGTLSLWFDGAPLNSEILADGHSIKYAGHTRMSVPKQLEYFRGLYKKPEMVSRDIDGLREVLGLQSAQTRLIVLEMPIAPQYFEENRGLRNLYPRARDMLVAETGKAGVPLWSTQETMQIPENDWYDLIHLGQGGSILLSTLVGERIGPIMESSQVPAP